MFCEKNKVFILAHIGHIRWHWYICDEPTLADDIGQQIYWLGSDFNTVRGLFSRKRQGKSQPVLFLCLFLCICSPLDSFMVHIHRANKTESPNIHPFSSVYPGLGCSGSRLSRIFQIWLSTLWRSNMNLWQKQWSTSLSMVKTGALFWSQTWDISSPPRSFP